MRARFWFIPSVVLGIAIALTNPNCTLQGWSTAVGDYSDDPSPTGSDDVPVDPLIIIGDFTDKENKSFWEFDVSLSEPSNEEVTVDFATQDDTARGGKDYDATSGIVRFAPGDTTETILVQVNEDRKPERNERFLVILSNPNNGEIADGEATGKIKNDDGKRR